MKWLPITLVFILAHPVNPVLSVRTTPTANDTSIAMEIIKDTTIDKNDINKNDIDKNKATVALATLDTASQDERIPDFSAYLDVKQKKRVFFEFMLPLIREANARIRNDRSELITLSEKLESGLVLSGGERQALSQLFKRYRFKLPQTVEAENVDELLERVDILPASLVLAQSANESGWGTSRFATEANNFFGIWCFRTGCGIEPSQRNKGLSHEIAAYASVQDGVFAYMHNINTHRAYRKLRAIRAEQRTLLNDLMGMELAQGLRHYSQRGEEYVREIQQMIRANKLDAYTLPTI
jgi:Bax protein